MATGDERDVLVATDLDGTLLDEDTYDYAPAEEALAVLRARRALVVLATSKTEAEVIPIARALDLRSALIVENGGAVIGPPGLLVSPPLGAARWRDGFVIELGTPRAGLVRHLVEIVEQSGATVRGFATLSVDEVASLTQLTREAAVLACDRRYDEPFLIEDDARLPGLVDAAERRGLRVTRGGRFYHLTGPTDKGLALQALLDAMRAAGLHFTTIGLGDSANDLALLATVERPVIIPRPGGFLDRELLHGLPHAERAPAPGPGGWNAAVLTILAGGALPTVGELAR